MSHQSTRRGREAGRSGRAGRRRSAGRKLAAFAIPVLMATGMGAAGRAQAQPASPPAAPHASTFSLPGLPKGPQKITLITGDQVTLKPAGGDRYAIGVRPATPPTGPGLGGATQVTARTSAAGVSEIAARPEVAQPYLDAGTVDRGLFDISYLAGHQTAGHIRLGIRYATAMTDAQLAATAGKLPASTVVRTQDSTDTATVDVDLAHAAALWTALTGQGSAAGRGSAAAGAAVVAGALAGGVSAVWLDGHRLGAAPATPATATAAAEPTYTVSEIIHARSEAQECSNLGLATAICLFTDALFGVDGAGAESVFLPTGGSCVDQNPVCRTVKITFRVPAGRYWLSGLTISLFDDRQQLFQVDNPEFRVVNDTTLDFRLDDATKVVNATPKPNDAFNGFLETARVLPDGLAATNLTFTAYGYNNFWATPTRPVTIGTYYMKTMWASGQPLLNLAVAGTHPVALHPTYPDYRSGLDQRFHGTQTLRLVDGGTGSAADLAGVDVRGKIVLMRPEFDWTCLVMRDQLQNALDGGAAGVLIDPAQPSAINATSCTLPMPAYWYFPDVFGGDHVDIPFAELKYQEAQALRAQLSHGPVKITITDNGPPAYMYDLTDVENGRIPASLTHRVTDNQLAETDAAYHSPQAVQGEELADTFLYDEAFTGLASTDFAVPTSRQNFIGPISPEILHDRTVFMFDSATGQQFADQQKTVVYDKAGRIGDEVWNDQPSPPGIPTFSGVAPARPGVAFGACVGCRQGNVFTPWAYPTSRDPQVEGFDINTGLDGLDPSTVHLYRAGQELPPTVNPFGYSGYTLTPESAQYQLVMDAGNTHTTWDFTSAEPTIDATPGAFQCGGVVFGVSGPCAPAPLIFLRYDAGTDLVGTVSAPARRQIKISGYGQSPVRPTITDFKVWTSVDGGTDWVPAGIANRGGGDYTASYQIPAPFETDGTVSIRVQARDAAGSDVTQVIIGAYAVTGR